MLPRAIPIPIALFVLEMHLNMLYFSGFFTLTLKTMESSH